MRITGIEIANYRGFAGDSFKLSLEKGENLLVYGENGAGKSSFFNSLKDFLHAATSKNVNIEQRRNRDNPTAAPAIRISTVSNPATEWTAVARGQDADNWRALDDGKGFLDYRQLLRFYNAPQDSSGRIELFDLLLKGMLANHRMEVSGTPTFLSEWRAIKHRRDYYFYGDSERQELKQRVARFNTAFKDAAVKLATRASELLHEFDPNIGIAFIPEKDADFTWYPKHVSDPEYFAEITRPQMASVTNYHEMFNEARLSAMAVCLFFAALETCPITGPRLMMLDDVLIGLDMGNRRIVMNLVQRLFRDWQIIILTYHKAWFEILKARVKVGAWGGHWRSVVLRPEKCNKTGLVAIAYADSGTALETADLCLARRDHKAAAVYARTALESVLHKHADRLHLSVQFKKNRLDLDTDDFLNPFEKRFEHLTDPLKRTQAEGLVAELRFVRRAVLNAFAHADEISEDEIAGEVDHGIKVVRDFEAFLAPLQKADFSKIISDAKPAVPQLLAQARQHAAAGNHKAAGVSLAHATALFVTEYAEAIGLMLPFKRNPSIGDLFKIVFPEDAMDAAEQRAFRRLIPYFLGSYKPKKFDPALMDETIRLILHTCYGQLLHALAKRALP
ncbi:MAG: AAA family ATPase [Verrucomicrobiota bacterium]|nr:AAA family ATPase [Verrucomicrobiota bacterium]